MDDGADANADGRNAQTTFPTATERGDKNDALFARPTQLTVCKRICPLALWGRKEDQNSPFFRACL